jgi:succinate-acetate transporter protein
VGFSLDVEADFTTQLLYASIKTGVGIHINDMGLNVLFDLLNYTAEIDNAALLAADGKGKNVRKTKPMSVADMTKAGRVKL